MTQTHTDTRHSESTTGYRVATRVIFPPDRDVDILPLYIDIEQKGQPKLRSEIVRGRFSLGLNANETVSLGSYFNAFPASYWRAWTLVRTVRLVVETSGDGAIIVYKSGAKANYQRVSQHSVSGNETTTIDLPLDTFIDGGFYWFDLRADSDEFVMHQAQWLVPDAGTPHGTATLATTTFNKPDWVIKTMRAIGSEPALNDVVDRLLIVDQGNDKVHDQPDFDEVVEIMGGRAEVINQPNLGGSGGFARGQYETATRGESDYVVLLDDDITMEPESILRIVTFADMCKKPTLVGGHMFDLLRRSVLHTYGEHVHPVTWQPSTVAPDQKNGWNFAWTGLRYTPWIHQRIDAGYNGWWMCLIPVSVIKEIGLSLPLFIKWDDSEYGIRAANHGYATVSLPGAALWHVNWGDKDDLVGWQAYFHERNRIITALIQSPAKRGGNLLRNSYMQDLKHLVSMQYYTAAGRLKAQEDVLAGPDQLHDILAQRNQYIRGLAKDYSDSTLKTEYDDFPPVRDTGSRSIITKVADMLPGGDGSKGRAAKIGATLKGGLAVLRQFTPVQDGAEDNPQRRVPHKYNHWWDTAHLDSALVTNAEGSGIAWYKRQPKLSRAMMAESLANHRKIYQHWDELAEYYRDALDDLVSFEAWEQTFGIK